MKNITSQYTVKEMLLIALGIILFAIGVYLLLHIAIGVLCLMVGSYLLMIYGQKKPTKPQPE